MLNDIEKYELPSKDGTTRPAYINADKETKPPYIRRFKLFCNIGKLVIIAFAYFFVQYISNDFVSEEGNGSPSQFDFLESLLNSTKTEDVYMSIPNAKSALLASRSYATHPHLAGSMEDFDDAKVILELFQKHFVVPEAESVPIYPAGSEDSRNATIGAISSTSPRAWIDIYYPVLNTPLNRSLEILDESQNTLWSADLEEDGDERDPEAAKYKDSVPVFHGLSCDGDVQGQLVYANYGSKEDYDELVEKGVNLTGKIVIARYGGVFRGLKIEAAQLLGAAGVLIYSDPRDDGSVTVENGYKPYPEGPARNPTSVQRGSVQFISKYPGDPTTPGYPAYENSTRTEGDNIPTIPSLPISWANAERLLKEISDSGSNRELNGKVSERNVRLVNHVDTKVTPIWNTMAVIPGHIRDEVVVIGNHRDAWVMGAGDPTSGTVSLHEVVKGFGALLKSGWRPLRTVMFTSWDAEEYGLVGSTEWAEDFPEWIQSHVVAYLNLDVSVTGSSWTGSSSPSLAHIIRQTALDVPHPTESGKTLWDARNDKGPFLGDIDADVLSSFEMLKASSDTGIGPLGSGSDFTVFLQRLGVASSNEGFGTTLSDAVYHYHSIYDSQRWQELYADPGFHRHIAVAKHLGLMALRLVDSIILPLNTSQYAFELDDYLNKVDNIASKEEQDVDLSKLRNSIAELQKASLSLDAEKVEAERKFRKLLEQLPRSLCRHGSTFYSRFEKFFFPTSNSSEHQQCNENLETLFSQWFDENRKCTHESAYSRIAQSISVKFPIRKFIRAAKRVQRANSKLVAFERGFISKDGIKDREWYKHLVVAPGKWSGYGATTLPALTESLTIDKNTTLAKYEVDRLVYLIDALAIDISI